MSNILIISGFSFDVLPLFLFFNKVFNTLTLDQLGINAGQLILKLVNSPLNNRLALLTSPLQKIVVTDRN